jgi:hypothetical protein
VLAAWALLGEALTPVQALGGAVVLAGLVLARQGDRTDTVGEASWPELPHSGAVDAAVDVERTVRGS